LRLRITPTEMAAVLGGQEAAEGLHMPGGAIWWVRLEAGQETELSSEGSTAIFTLSPLDLQQLADSETEGVYFATDEGIRYFIEKDFPCVHKRAEETREQPTETFTAPADFERRKLEKDRIETNQDAE